jgi:hypothetical protein
VKKLILALLCMSLTFPAFAKDNGYNVKYDGGSISDVKAGNDLKLLIDSGQIRLFSTHSRFAYEQS